MGIMGPVSIPNQDAMYLQWIENFAVKAAANAAELGFSDEEIEAMSELAEQYAEAYEASHKARVAALSASGTKREARERSEEVFRAMARRANANETIPAGLKGQLGMGIQKAPPSPVSTPDNLVVSGDEIGVNRLSWSPNGNSRSVSYIIEYRPHGQSDWQILTATSTLKYQHTGQIPGQRVSYRVSAKRSNTQSSPCASVSVYDGIRGSSIPLPVAA